MAFISWKEIIWKIQYFFSRWICWWNWHDIYTKFTTQTTGPTVTGFAIIHDFLSSSALIFRVFSWSLNLVQSSFLDFSLRCINKSWMNISYCYEVLSRCVENNVCFIKKRFKALIRMLVLITNAVKNWLTFLNALWLLFCLFATK